ncbi:uncharacterized protein BJ171DRAFT_532071 [Polychytrium aggregatum]|uniref:uncharacterized protein n=1 Tax=Polychytrium aggregatum TaxID=110093 RepID=UPI0022FF44B4|nr:uncharacterized protein BJ171DRAFT_532071 [Polychytrium aggregatum]KAI9193196.1 hypothetical protein BJ171DRAFT_532071 [Polychytrium aggregatum]
MGPTLLWIFFSRVSLGVLSSLSVDSGLASGSCFSRILYLSVVIEHPTPSVVILQPKSCFPSFLAPKSLGSSLKLVCQKVSCFVVSLTLVFRSSHLSPVPVWYPRISHSAVVSSLTYFALASQSGTKVHCARGMLCRFLVWASRSASRLIRFVLTVTCLHTSSCWVWNHHEEGLLQVGQARDLTGQNWYDFVQVLVAFVPKLIQLVGMVGEGFSQITEECLGEGILHQLHTLIDVCMTFHILGSNQDQIAVSA